MAVQADHEAIPLEPTFDAVYTQVLGTLACRACHGSVWGQGGLSITTADATYLQLVNVPSTAQRCRGQMMVAPGNPDASTLYQAIARDVAACGQKMPPLGSYALSDAQIELVKNWITAGAKR